MTTTSTDPRPGAPAPSRAAARRPSARHVLLATLALATGGFAIGTTEFVTMGLLPEIARGVNVSIPQGGHLISAYALGVVVGAPLIAVLGARAPRKGLLLGLMAVFALGNLASALAAGDGALTLARFLAGIPHGAFFGVASLVAASLVDPARRGRAVSLVMLGLPVANIVGVPTATWMGQHLGWRSAYVAVTVLGVLTIALVASFVPRSPADRAATGRRELRAFGSVQVWLTLLVGAVGFGGMFAMYSYIAPTVTDVTGLSKAAVPVFLFAYGLGGTVGTFLGGRLADWSNLRALVVGSVGMGASLALFTVSARAAVTGVATVFLVACLASVLVVNLQMRLMHVAGDAQTLGAAMNHAALNLANALGAWLGGLVIAAGWGYTAPSWVGVRPVVPRAGRARALGRAAPAAHSADQLLGEHVVADRVDEHTAPQGEAAALDARAREAVGLDDVPGGGVRLRGVDHHPSQPQPAVVLRHERVPHDEPAGLGHHPAAARGGVRPVADLGLAARLEVEEADVRQQLVGVRVRDRPADPVARRPLLHAPLEVVHGVVVGVRHRQPVEPGARALVVARLCDPGRVVGPVRPQDHAAADDPRDVVPRVSRAALVRGQQRHRPTRRRACHAAAATAGPCRRR